MTARILIVDDQPSIIATILRFFQRKGCYVRGAATAEEALAAVEREAFDVIFLDQVLPGMSGLQAIGELRRRSAAAILIMTGCFDEKLRKDALRLGAIDVLAKPLNFGELEKRVAGIVGSALPPQETDALH